MDTLSYETALKEHQAGNLDLAEKLYQDILKNTPQDSNTLHLLSILFAERGDFINAYKHIETALKIAPKSPSFHNTMGGILKNLHQYKDAILHYQQSLQLHPNNPSAHNNLGNVLYKLGNLSQAKKHYHEAIRLRPKYLDAYCNLSLVSTKQNLYQEAISYLETALQIQPDHDFANQQLGYLLQLQGTLTQAACHYNIALKSNENNVLAHHNLGVLLTNEEKHDEAVPHFKKVLELQPEHIEALHNLGSIFLLQKKLTEALPHFLRLIQLTGEFDAYYNTAVIYMDLGRLDDAAGYFCEAIKLRPDDFATYVNLGTIYLRLQNFIEAEKYYNHAHLLQPNNQETSYILKALRQKTDVHCAPSEYIQRLFDQYAPYFEQHLKLLNYQVPQILFEAIQTIIESKNHDSSLRILDLGCGTGLSGCKFKPIAKELIGIDLSENMLELARQKNVYTTLKNLSIENAICTFSNIDIIIAAESLVYVGDLAKVFVDCYNTLKPNGIFGFTVEKTDHYPYLLQRSARFAHSAKYINEVAKQNNFTILKSDEIALRNHHDTVVMGYIYILLRSL